MKTKEEILSNHIVNGMDRVFIGIYGKILKERVFLAMEEYASQRLIEHEGRKWVSEDLIKQDYFLETGEKWINGDGEPDIDYVEWLERKLISPPNQAGENSRVS